MEAFDVAQLIELVGQFGFATVFLWLFVREMNSHEATREYYRRDLREIAGMRRNSLFEQDDDTKPRQIAANKTTQTIEER